MNNTTQNNKKGIQNITPEGLEQLKAELDNRVSVLRNEIAGKIDEARRFGDLSENNAYSSAMEEKNFNEARIEELEDVIGRSNVIEDTKSGVISLGKVVHLKGDKGTVTYKIVGVEESDPQKSLISDRSPIGKSLMGKKMGDKVVVQIPAGDMEFTIVKVE